MAWVDVVGFRDPPRTPKLGPWQPRRAQPWTPAQRRRARLRDAAWLPVAALLGLVGGGYVGITGGDTAPVGVFANGSFPPCSRASQPNCVIDGDTIRYDGVKIRLADIDAPEVFSPKCASEAALGERATQRLVEIINAGPFELVRAGGRDEDIYGRKLRVAARGGRSVADTLVAEGLARRWDGARRGWCG
jgi:micrococcal nuclease